ncbi:PQQ-dependent sugar dehydrogenase [Massilia psychrophila]|uniref:CHRD domain-containing protein n=1 Tax=Massilia psychrophila TaxID=1603353 RepID=A0A2G8SZJ6_9BURK|nr:PQQ-dependent sugar dehydrogenase [Massilia psychrophila]PIL39142.1 CHRD domain-containing protein [Massilia psychrophila]GGE85234.1 protein up-regulated by thyroid hormone-PQQ-dependent glucose dehydrogenase [Massilia psychrophila]
MMKIRMITRMLIQGVAGIAVATAYSSAGAQQPVPLADPIPALIPQSPLKVALETVMSGLVSPVATAAAPGDRRHLYVADQIGQVWRFRTGDREDHDDADNDNDDKDKDNDDDNSGRGSGSRQPELFLDVSKLLIAPLGLGPGKYDERGLLGIAFHPQFKFNGLFYTFTSQPVKNNPDFSTMPQGVAPNCQSVVTEWRVKRPGERNNSVDLTSARELLRIDKPQFNHNGGALAFGADQMLYVSLGDGGGADDEGVGHAPEGNAQSLAPGNVLGKILRIDPLGRNSANGKYGIPPDNPFVSKTGADEIFAYGFRNPFRMSIDRDGHVIAGDVGQNAIEEIDVVTAGGNYGWRIKEGTFLFNTAGPTAPGFVYRDSPGMPATLIDPIAQYDHADSVGGNVTRVAVIGGYVYRGNKLRQLRDQYVFGDYAGRGTPSPRGNLFVLGRNQRVESLVPSNRNPFDLAVLGFGQDARGELYVLASGTGTLLGKTGVVMKLVPGQR